MEDDYAKEVELNFMETEKRLLDQFKILQSNKLKRRNSHDSKGNCVHSVSYLLEESHKRKLSHDDSRTKFLTSKEKK